jgi:hypothetical protein
MTARLVAELFVGLSDRVVASLDTGEGGEAQFLFLSSDRFRTPPCDPCSGSVQLNEASSYVLGTYGETSSRYGFC